MTQQEIKSVAAEIAQKLGSYPMLATIILLTGLVGFIHVTDREVTGAALQKLVFGELEWHRKQNDLMLQKLNECYTRTWSKGKGS